jgi:hypothetical protein
MPTTYLCITLAPTMQLTCSASTLTAADRPRPRICARPVAADAACSPPQPASASSAFGFIAGPASEIARLVKAQTGEMLGKPLSSLPSPSFSLHCISNGRTSCAMTKMHVERCFCMAQPLTVSCSHPQILQPTLANNMITSGVILETLNNCAVKVRTVGLSRLPVPGNTGLAHRKRLSR